MSVQFRGPDAGEASWRPLIPGLLVLLLAVTLAVALGLYVRSGIESLEEKLSY